jgi:hypothetical protein
MGSLGSGDTSKSPDRRISDRSKQIHALRVQKDVQGLQKLALEIKAEWLATKRIEYYPVIRDVCLALNSTRTTEPGIAEAIRDLAVAAH